ncbi:DUF1983 domain-containing protein [Pseudomonas sp. NMI542_15]|uniref:DUF1983 domain-containing protein n=1 Tax=Pseudomonas sp. NMI542_15 TaxID=2903148 RepID=UPI001E5CA2D9|nr:DUF1983 domain-containing protein [Pseudomonas sp. NMI542_15]MCE0778931.1 DUF1983 domain-containing protein [Pseudomonas sp. NMI542_15]
MQSVYYVPGVSGWKIDDYGRLVLNDGNRRIHAEVKMITTAGPGLTNDQAAQQLRDLRDEDSDTPPTDEQLAALCLTRQDLVEPGGLLFAKVATDAIVSLQGVVSELIAKVASLSGQVSAQGGTVTPQGQAITGLTNTIENEVNARRDADIALGQYSVKLGVNDQGHFYVAGVGLGMNTVARSLKLGPSLEDDVRRLLRDELKPGGILHRS